MVNLSVTFYINLLSVIATTYILTWYILTPSPNQCQMTFMMEPPKFLPIEVDQDDQDEHLTYPAIKTGPLDDNTRKAGSEYALYMYSEFGFPMASDVRRDLKDSMPVLFVPGNAGSYQQVRSLASTCIRKQLQSLDAFKFIFYTIDFGGQFSGISGELIDRQTQFVQKSLRQITKLQPSDTGGVILIGHSVGGFISKFLFTKPNFQPNSVPLLISLASPLTRPYLALDNKMSEIYRKTDQYWNKSMPQDRNTIAISISGGGYDRLVPMHLSLDPAFDLSLTTECMRDVFLSTDHVCVTWCRQLMHKLANLLSALMDKKQTRLINDKSLKLAIIERELLLKKTSDNSAILSRGDWSTMRPNEVLNINDIHLIHRNQLKDNIFIFSQTIDHDLLITIDHIEPPKSTIIFGCSGVSSDDNTNQITCHGRSDLMFLSNLIPTSRFEPRRSIIKLSRSLMAANSINHIGIDCTSQTNRAALPELISIQKISNQASSRLIIPSLLESFLRRILFLPIRLQILPRLNSTTELVEIELSDLELGDNPALSITLVSDKCPNKGKPNSATMLYYRDGYMSASAHLSTEAKDQQANKIKLSIRETILKTGSNMYDRESHLDVYLDGTCENYLEVDLDLLDLAANMLQRDLGTILSCISFLVTGSIVFLANEITEKRVMKFNIVRFVVLSLGSILIVVIPRLVSSGRRSSMLATNWLDNSTSIMLTSIFSYGLVSFLNYFIRRLIDLATIINNTHMVLKRKVTSSKEGQSDSDDRHKNGHANNKEAQDTASQLKMELDWPMIGLAIASGPFLSSISITVLPIFLLIKTSLALSSDTGASESSNRHCRARNHINQEASTNDRENNLVVNLIIMSAFVLVVNIPDLILEWSGGIDLSNLTAPKRSSSLSADYAAISLILIMQKLICDKLEKGSSNRPNGSQWMRNNPLLRGLFNLTTSKFASTLTLIPIILIESNIRLMTSFALLITMWLLNHLNFNLVKST